MFTKHTLAKCCSLTKMRSFHDGSHMETNRRIHSPNSRASNEVAHSSRTDLRRLIFRTLRVLSSDDPPTVPLNGASNVCIFINISIHSLFTKHCLSFEYNVSSSFLLIFGLRTILCVSNDWRPCHSVAVRMPFGCCSDAVRIPHQTQTEV